MRAVNTAMHSRFIMLDFSACKDTANAVLALAVLSPCIADMSLARSLRSLPRWNGHGNTGVDVVLPLLQLVEQFGYFRGMLGGEVMLLADVFPKVVELSGAIVEKRDQLPISFPDATSRAAA